MRSLKLSFALFLLSLPVSAWPGQRQSDDTKPKFQLTISAPTEVFAGSPVKVEVTLTNISDHVIGIERMASEKLGEFAYQLDVRDHNGSPVDKTRYMRAVKGEDIGDHDVFSFSPRTQALKPGESTKDEILLSRCFDLTWSGTYSVQVERKDDSGHTVKSNTIMINVTNSVPQDQN